MPAQPASSPVSSNVSSLCAHSFAPTGPPEIYCAPGPETSRGEPRLPAPLPGGTCVSAGSPIAPTSWPGCEGGTQRGWCRKTGQGPIGWAWPPSPSLTPRLGMREKPPPPTPRKAWLGKEAKGSLQP